MRKPTLKKIGKKESQEKTPKTEFTSYQSFRLQKPIKGTKITGSFRLLGQAFKIFGKHWKLFLGIVFWYALLNLVFVYGFQTVSDVDETKVAYDEMFSGGFGQLAASASLFVYLLGSGGEAVTATTAMYQIILAIAFSLVLIWVMRQVYAGQKIRVRDGFYLGMAPLVPFLLVLVVVALQLLPMAVGGTLFSTVVTGGIATTGIELALWGVLFFMLALVSLYMVASSLFALYIVTLPEMTPMAALHSARELVRYRRWAVLRRVVFLPLALVILTGLLIIPIILFATPIAAWALFAVNMLLLPIIHSYMYALYRALI